ncbi:MAG: Carotenogenesis protein CarS [Myxococcaceae bacterium]|jgi:hypothetical protein|nr:Carotenogenesis protein CarS [Myxococcaceae bacterium]MCA3015775.1 Carotenogenesis protein CarS [Myxococcaceae bacterium]
MKRTTTPALPAQAVFSRTDIAGAPLRVGQPVVVVCSDDDDSADERFHGCRGEVAGLLYDDPARQFPSNPLVLVAVAALGEEWFFLSELYDEAARRQAERAADGASA